MRAESGGGADDGTHRRDVRLTGRLLPYGQQIAQQSLDLTRGRRVFAQIGLDEAAVHELVQLLQIASNVAAALDIERLHQPVDDRLGLDEIAMRHFEVVGLDAFDTLTDEAGS